MRDRQKPWFFWLNVVVLLIFVAWLADSVVRKGEWPWVAFFLGAAVGANVVEGVRQRKTNASAQQ